MASGAAIDGRHGRPPIAHTDPGVAGNARLTGMTGVVLFVLLGVEGLTIVGLRFLFPEHLFFGFVLIPPVLLKLSSTGYRFLRYYTGNPRYRAAGPPHPIPRLIAPVVVLTTVAIFATGVELWAFGLRYGGLWLRAHQLAFVIWFFATSVHVLSYLVRAPSLAFLDVRRRTRLPDSDQRRSLVAGAILLGFALALATARYATPFARLGHH